MVCFLNAKFVQTELQELELKLKKLRHQSQTNANAVVKLLNLL